MSTRLNQLIAHAESGSLKDMAGALRELAAMSGGAVTWAEVQNKPAFGALATEDAASSAQVNVDAYAGGGISAGTLQSVLEALADRVTDLENA